MSKLPSPPMPAKSVPCPVHQRLLAQLAEVRRAAGAFTRASNRYGYVRYQTPENTYLRAVQWALEHAEASYQIAIAGEGRLELGSYDGPDGLTHPVLLVRRPPAKVVDLKEYRERRQARAS